MGCSLKFLVAVSIFYAAASLWATTNLTAVQNMTWVYPLLVAVLIANIGMLAVRYLWVVRRRILLALLAYLLCELCVMFALAGTTGLRPQLSFEVWRPVIVFGRQMQVLAGVWLAYTFWRETFRVHGRVD